MPQIGTAAGGISQKILRRAARILPAQGFFSAKWGLKQQSNSPTVKNTKTFEGDLSRIWGLTTQKNDQRPWLQVLTRRHGSKCWSVSEVS